MENSMRNKTLVNYRNGFLTGTMALALSTAIGGLIAPATAAAPDKKDEISFDLGPNTQFIDGLKGSYGEPKAHATVIRGRLNDTLILELEGFKSGLAFDLFTVERSSFL